MEHFENLISYFCEYDLYNDMFSPSIKDKSTKDVLLEQCDFTYLSATMMHEKVDKIYKFLRCKITSQPFDYKDNIRLFVEDKIPLDDFCKGLVFKTPKYINENKDSISKIKNNKYFCIYSPVFLNQQKKSQLHLLTFSCQLLEDSYIIDKIYTNKDAVAIIVAYKQNIDVSDARIQYKNQIDDISRAIDVLNSFKNFDECLSIAHEEFKKIFGFDISEFENSNDWQMLAKSLFLFGSPNNLSVNCFRDELDSIKKYISQGGIIPATVKHYLGVPENAPTDIKSTTCNTSYLGSYQANYAVNKRQWELVQLANNTKFLCVEGPPGTGKTTLLKELIADTIVKKADSLLSVWNDTWQDLGKSNKNVIRSPLGGENLNSIVISSTNNKAINNIGLELLSEISYFSDFTKSIQNDGNKYSYSGIFCARLGNSENICNFYNTLFKPFCDYLSSYKVNANSVDKIKNDYIKLHDKLEQINQRVMQVIAIKSKIDDFLCLDNLNNKQKCLENDIHRLSQQGILYESDMVKQNELLQTVNEHFRSAEPELAKHQSILKLIENQIHNLYTDLNEYENIKGFKKLFSFLFPNVKAILEKYGSAEHIRDLIQDSKKQLDAIRDSISATNTLLTNLTYQRFEVSNAISDLTANIEKIRTQQQEVVKQNELLITYRSYFDCLSEQTECSVDSLIKMSAYQLNNIPYIVKLRNHLFKQAVKLIESYIFLHKEPILNNLKIILSENNGNYYWCRPLYTSKDDYSENRALLIQSLWETFFLCFPTITTTMHSFRKSTFQMIPNLFDILMIDESGQIVPYFAIAPLYRARRAIFVGDVNQIEPIKHVPPNLLEDKYTKILGDSIYSRYCIDYASAQSYAVTGSEYYEKVQEQISGVILSEHRRCESAIMSFSNKYIYNNVLDLKIENDNNKIFGSNLVAFDIRGLKSNQHHNQSEIDACKEIVQLLVKTYGEYVMDDIGVITPFASQANKIHEAISRVEVGTVHTFQGAEKKYIIFSSVIDDTAKSAGLIGFIGGKGNLLNVAFSRAKKQFIFIGNLQAAETSKNYLKDAVDSIKEHGKIFSLFDINHDEKITDKDIILILTGTQIKNSNDEIGKYLQCKIPHNVIDYPALHNEILNNMLLMCTSNIHIISPWISGNVVTRNMLDIIKNKLQSDILIRITFGYKAIKCSLNDIDELVEEENTFGSKEDAKAVINELKSILGSELRYSPPSHVKLLLVDDKYLFIGSLNWLLNGGKTEQKEISCLITNQDMIRYVKEKYLN